jgi:hypothetical protein
VKGDVSLDEELPVRWADVIEADRTLPAAAHAITAVRYRWWRY